MIKKALVHEWFETPAGSENCVRSFVNIWKDIDVFGVVDFFDEERRNEYVAGKPITTTFIQNLPFSEKHFRTYLPLMPFAIEQLDMSSYDLVFSSSHAVAKGVLTRANQLHVCYCHAPMRYAWDLYHQYIKESRLDKGIKGLIARYILHRLRIWDFTTSLRVDHFIANSKYTARRIKKTYNREAEVIYPPVDTFKFKPSNKTEDFYLTASRLVPYKKVDLVVEAFAKMPDKRLLVLGDGPEMEKVKSKASRNIEVLGYRPFGELSELMSKCKAFVFAAEEDFGIMVIESMAAGRPVIAFNRGGASESVIDGVNGIHFNEQTPDSICEAVTRYEKNENKFQPGQLREYAEKFSRSRFEEEINNFVRNKCEQFFNMSR